MKRAKWKTIEKTIRAFPHLMDDAYACNRKQAKKMIKARPCLAFYHMIEKAKRNSAIPKEQWAVAERACAKSRKSRGPRFGRRGAASARRLRRATFLLGMLVVTVLFVVVPVRRAVAGRAFWGNAHLVFVQRTQKWNGSIVQKVAAFS